MHSESRKDLEKPASLFPVSGTEFLLYSCAWIAIFTLCVTAIVYIVSITGMTDPVGYATVTGLLGVFLFLPLGLVYSYSVLARTRSVSAFLIRAVSVALLNTLGPAAIGLVGQIFMS